ncbi:YbjQ family protein [Geitlerinema sp. PCC 9228]|jgi:uncharacterized protein YbjQ (UPF0145 family)|uniref:YbjQ family protein n=1 Tax=Geitlerinema sp. PCC 9228 TaxID=111611 RepID=UPI0008F9872A|nr:YbjQ family protein [Geitlerinema sp. PCC 9228]
MILSTTDVLQDRAVEEYLGVVSAEVVYGGNALRDWFAGFRDFFGGRTGSYENLFQKGHQQVLAELQERAEELDANAVVGIQIDTGTINVDEKGSMMVITGVGTAVRVAE